MGTGRAIKWEDFFASGTNRPLVRIDSAGGRVCVKRNLKRVFLINSRVLSNSPSRLPPH